MQNKLPKQHFYRSDCAPGFTLVEVLLAMSLTGLVFAISGRVVVQMSETRNSVQLRNARAEQRLVLESVISDDFARMLPIEIKNKPPLVVVEGSNLVLELPVLATVLDDEESLHTPLKPCLIRYWKHREPDANYKIEREIIDLTDPARVIRKVQVASGIEQLNVAIRRKGEWSDLATVTLLDAKEVEAVRILARWDNVPVEWQRTFRIEHVK